MNESELPLTAVPADVDELNDLVVRTVMARWGSVPVERGPGLYTMRFPTVEVLLSTDFDPPLVVVSGVLVTDIVDRDAALENVNVLNVGFPHLTFVITEGSLVVKEHVQAMPLVPDHLYVALSSLTDLSRDLGESLAETFGGQQPA